MLKEEINYTCVALLIAVLILVALCFAPGAAETPALITISPNQEVIIVVPEEPSQIEERAANDLAFMLGKVLNKTFTILSEDRLSSGVNIVIAVGNTKISREHNLPKVIVGKSDDTLLVGAFPETREICLVGKKDLGVLFAVSHFLETFAGVRWYLPGDLGQVIPAKKALTVPAGVTIQSPDFPMRRIGKKFASDWALFNKMNTNLFKKEGFNIFGTAHTFHEFLSPDKYFKSHPEYFAEIKGKRRPRQLCTSNPEVIRLVAEAIIRLFKDRTYLDMGTLFPQDSVFFCECANCRALDDPDAPPVQAINSRSKISGPQWHKYRSLSRRMTIFYVEVAKRVLTVYPNAKIQVGAYKFYLYPYGNIPLRAPENVFVEMCHGWDHNHHIESDASEINMRFRAALDDWRKIYAGVTIYEYYRKLAHLDLPFPILHSIEKDIPYFNKVGIYGLYTQFGKDYYTNGLNYYIAARLLWDSSQSVAEIMDDFCKNFYGASAEYMKAYYNNYEKAAIDADIVLSCPVYELDKVFTKDMIEKQNRLIEQALQNAENQRIKKRIRRSHISLLYVKLCMDYLYRTKETVRRGIKVAGIDLFNKAEEIRNFREQNKWSHCFGRHNDYISRFLNPDWLLKQIINSSNPQEK